MVEKIFPFAPVQASSHRKFEARPWPQNQGHPSLGDPISQVFGAEAAIEPKSGCDEKKNKEQAQQKFRKRRLAEQNERSQAEKKKQEQQAAKTKAALPTGES